MDSNQWNALSQYGRLNTPVSSTSLYHDRNALDQQQLTSSLSTGLTAHAGFGGLPNYGHAIHTSVLDTSGLAAAVAGTSPYKTIPVQPVIGLDSMHLASQRFPSAAHLPKHDQKLLTHPAFPTSLNPPDLKSWSVPHLSLASKPPVSMPEPPPAHSNRQTSNLHKPAYMPQQLDPSSISNSLLEQQNRPVYQHTHQSVPASTQSTSLTPMNILNTPARIQHSSTKQHGGNANSNINLTNSRPPPLFNCQPIEQVLLQQQQDHLRQEYNEPSKTSYISQPVYEPHHVEQKVEALVTFSSSVNSRNDSLPQQAIYSTPLQEFAELSASQTKIEPLRLNESIDASTVPQGIITSNEMTPSQPVAMAADSTTQPKKKRPRKKRVEMVTQEVQEPSTIDMQQLELLRSDTKSPRKRPKSTKLELGNDEAATQFQSTMYTSPPSCAYSNTTQEQQPQSSQSTIKYDTSTSTYNAVISASVGGQIVYDPEQSNSYLMTTSLLDDGVFMTNSFGNSFVNPQEILAISHPDQSIIQPQQIYKGPISSVKQADVVDEEFAHLVQEPEVIDDDLNSKFVVDKDSRHLPNSNVVQNTLEPSKSTGPVRSGFEQSFLSFIEGNKGETLSSVTNTVLTGKRPQLPKYVPEQRPRTAAKLPPKLEGTNEEVVRYTAKYIPSSSTESIQNNTITLSDDDSSELSAISRPPIKMKIKRQKVSKKSRTVVGIEDYGRREVASRKAKQKVEEKRRARKIKRLSGSSFDEDFVDFSDDGEEYDSDKDPAWDPFRKEVPLMKRDSSGSEDESKAYNKQRYKGKITKRKLQVDRQSSSVAPEGERSLRFEKGNFVIDKRDMTKIEGFPIWRIDAGRLLQKFEFVKHSDGTITHKSLSTYSSWTDDISLGYSPIMVRIIESSGNGDTVKVLDQYLPKCQSMEEDPILGAFNIFIQILVSQAMEPNFIRIIQQENESYYLEPMAEVDALLEGKRFEILCKIRWNKQFQDVVESKPHLSITPMNPDMRFQACQASLDTDLPASLVVLLYGDNYNRNTMEFMPSTATSIEFRISSDVEKSLQAYHRLYHFKYTLYKRCLAKVEVLRESNGDCANPDILDQCLQNRSWVQQLLNLLRGLLCECDQL